jgi:hypothetical protein
MISLMILTFFGTIAVTAKPATAAQMSNPPLQVKTSHWASWVGPLFNVHETAFYGNTPQHAEISQGAKLATTIAAVQNSEYGTNTAYLGVKFHVKDWEAVKTKLVLVTVNLKYDLSLRLTSTTEDYGSNWIYIADSSNPTTLRQTIAFQDQPGTICKPLASARMISTLEQLGTGIPGEGQIIVALQSTASMGTLDSAYCSGHVYVYNIQLQWL